MLAAATYRRAGVDIAKADALLGHLGRVIRATHGPEVLRDRGQFAGLFALSSRRYREPVLVASTDGVGTKLALAQLVGNHRSIGIDAVAMNTNDVLVYGARPLFVLDYIAMGRLTPRIYRQLIEGVAEGCRQSGCALIGGETAEMPGVYGPGEYDIAGFCVGVVERRRLLDGSTVRAGDAVVGLASSGIHANGFSLVRNVLDPTILKRYSRTLLTPTRIYVKPVLAALERLQVHAIAHVTGGGLARRLPSLVAKQRGLRVAWKPGTWTIPKIFRGIQDAGHIETSEMYATFNMGIGMVLVCRSVDVPVLQRIMGRFGIQAWSIGMVERSRG